MSAVAESSTDLLKTPLHALHLELGAKMMAFAGYDMPVNYPGGIIAEHKHCRDSAALFDVSHMGIVDLSGARSRELLQYLLANDVARLGSPGRALYSCMLNHAGGVLDDLIVYLLAADQFRVVVNAGTRDRYSAWIGEVASCFDVALTERSDLAMIAVQGPQARERVLQLLSPAFASAALALSLVALPVLHELDRPGAVA